MSKSSDGKNWIVYLITNSVNGKSYVGITCRPLEIRWKAHLYRAAHNWKQILYNAIRKYGSDAFSLKIIDRADSLLNAGILESHHITELGSYHTEHGYNMTYGGEGTLGWDPPAEWREAVSKREKGRKMPEERKQEYSVRFSGSGNPRYGAILSDVTREKMSNAHKLRAVREGRVYKSTPVRLGPKKYHMVTYNGETKNLTEWCHLLGLNYRRVLKRVTFYGYTYERAFNTTKEEELLKRSAHLSKLATDRIMKIIEILSAESNDGSVCVYLDTIAERFGVKKATFVSNSTKLAAAGIISKKRGGQGKPCLIHILK